MILVLFNLTFYDEDVREENSEYTNDPNKA